VDIVKLLKSQDENYIRTIRAAGLKVNSQDFTHFPHRQCTKRIAALKLELSNLINLLPTSHSSDAAEFDELSEAELRILHSVGLISSSSSGPSPASPTNWSRDNSVRVGGGGAHVVFVNDHEEGMWTSGIILRSTQQFDI
jgi:U3 small nucleolar RNA-associated protein 11